MMTSLLRASAVAALFLAPIAAHAACTPAVSDDNLIEKGKLQLSINPTNPPQHPPQPRPQSRMVAARSCRPRSGRARSRPHRWSWATST